MSVAHLTPFHTKFQPESTSSHLLFEELEQVLQLLLKRFVKLDALKDKSAAQLLLVQLDNRPVEVWVWHTNSWRIKETAGR